MSNIGQSQSLNTVYINTAFGFVLVGLYFSQLLQVTLLVSNNWQDIYF